MKIFQMMAKLELGGAQKILILLADRFNGYVISGEGGRLFQSVKLKMKERHTVIKHLRREINPIYDILAFIETRRLLIEFLRREGKIILHTHGSKAGVIGALASVGLKNIKVVHTVHGFAIHPYNPFYVNLFYIILERAASMFRDALVFPSPATMERAKKLGIGNKEKYRCVLNGVEIPLKPKREKNKILTIGTIANFKSQKNPFVWTDVAKKILKIRNVRFVYCGGGPLFGRVKELFKGEKRVEFTGWVNDPYEYLKKFDIFFLPSRWEGLPLSLLEAMSFKIPPVVSNICGNRDVIKDGITGFLCSPDDVECFTEKLTILIDDKNLRSIMGKRAYQEIKKNYTLEKMVKGYEVIYREMGL